MSKIRSLICYFLILGCFWLWGCKTSQNEVDARRLRDQCKKIKIGMAHQEALKLMGEPSNITEFEKDGRKKNRYIYLLPILSSTSTQFVVDKQSGLVEEVLCGES